MHQEPNGTVSYTVKELLARQDGKLDTIILTLNAKAEKTELAALEQRVLGLERSDSRSEGGVSLFWKAGPLLVSLAALAAAVAVALR
jgi:hypothetical protein